MAGALERDNVSLVGHDDLDGRPPFKLAITNVDGSWYLYGASWWHSGWSVVDVTDPSSPEVLNFIEGPENTGTWQLQVADGLLITGLERPRSNWGVVGEEPYDPDGCFTEGAFLWDVGADPVRPERLGHFETGSGGTHRNFYNGGDYAYMCTRHPEYTDYFLTVLDVSDPSSPREVTRWWWPGQADGDDEDPTAASYFHGPAYVVGDRAYLSYGDVGMVILDISDVEDPQLVSRTPFGPLGSGRGVHSTIPIPGTDLLAVNSETSQEGAPLDDSAPSEPLNYTFLVDISDESPSRFVDCPDSRTHAGLQVVSAMPMPIPESGLPYSNYHEKPGRFGPHNQHHPRGDDDRLQSDEFLVMTYFNAGLRVFDISDPLAPTEAGYYVPEDPDERVGTRRPASGLVSQFEDVVVDARGYIYCTDPHHGLFVFETDLF